MGVEALFSIASLIASIGIVVGTAESLATLSLFADDGVYGWPVMSSATSRFLRPVGALAFVRVVLGTRFVAATILAVCAALVMFGAHRVSHLEAGLWAILAGSSLYLRWRQRIGDDGSDQMLLLISVSFTLCSQEGGREIALAFVGAQSILAYTTAGIAKLVSPMWRRGAVSAIVATETYGIVRLGKWISHSSIMDRALSWAVIVFETAFLLAPVLPYYLLAVLLCIGALFHLVNAVVMGLNTFFWAFLATFPAMWFINSTVTSRMC